MRLPAQLAPKPCALADSRLTMPGRSGPTTVTTIEVTIDLFSSESDTVRLIMGARVAKRSSCLKAGRLPCSAACFTTSDRSFNPIGASERSHSSRAVSPLATKHQSCAATAPASQPSAR